MATVKRVDGDYRIVSVNPEDNVTVTTNTFEVQGNLDISGNLTYINVTELNIADPFILLNSSNTGSYEPNSGILTHKTESTFAGLRYNQDNQEWQISVDTSTTGETGTWVPIATGTVVSSAAGSNTEIQFNDDGSFGASADFVFDFGNSELTLNGTQRFANIPTAPGAVANTVAVYHQGVGSGGTGVYVKTDTVDDELVSRSKAIVFGIIF